MPRDEKRCEEERSKYIVSFNGGVRYLSLTSSQVDLLVWLGEECEIAELEIQRFISPDFIKP